MRTVNLLLPITQLHPRAQRKRSRGDNRPGLLGKILNRMVEIKNYSYLKKNVLLIHSLRHARLNSNLQGSPYVA